MCECCSISYWKSCSVCRISHHLFEYKMNKDNFTYFFLTREWKKSNQMSFKSRHRENGKERNTSCSFVVEGLWTISISHDPSWHIELKWNGIQCQQLLHLAQFCNNINNTHTHTHKEYAKRNWPRDNKLQSSVIGWWTRHKRVNSNKSCLPWLQHHKFYALKVTKKWMKCKLIACNSNLWFHTYHRLCVHVWTVWNSLRQKKKEWRLVSIRF